MYTVWWIRSLNAASSDPDSEAVGENTFSDQESFVNSIHPEELEGILENVAEQSRTSPDSA